MASTLVEGIMWLLATCVAISAPLVKYGLIAAASYLVYYFGIKPFISPIRKIPGLPYKMIMGNIPDITVGKEMSVSVEKIVNLRKKYGCVLRFYYLLGMERVLVTDPDLMKHIMVTNSRNYKKPSVSFLRMLQEVLGDGLITLNGTEHATHKRLISPSFNNASIKSMIPIFEEAGKKLVNQWASYINENTKAKIPVQNELSSTTLDVIGKTAFGYDFKSLENPNEPVNKAFQDFLEGQSISRFMSLPHYLKFPFPDVLALKRMIKIMHDKVYHIINSKRKEIEKGTDFANVTKDILGIMMMARDEESGTGLTKEELKSETMTLMGAGHETTSTAMAWFLLHMAKNPDVQKKCQAEVREHLSDSTPITWELLERLQYLDCAIKETLRLTPSVPMVARETIQDDKYYDFEIPKGTIVILGIAPMMRSADIFEDPDSFKPERFMISDEANKNMYKFLPFVIGPRMCLGYKFAMVEMKVILACLLQKLNFDMIPGRKFRPSTANRITMRPYPSLELYGSTDA